MFGSLFINRGQIKMAVNFFTAISITCNSKVYLLTATASLDHFLTSAILLPA